MANNADRIAEIQTILRNGASSVNVDGTMVDYDFDALRAELRDLMAEDEDFASRRPRAATIRLGGF